MLVINNERRALLSSVSPLALASAAPEQGFVAPATMSAGQAKAIGAVTLPAKAVKPKLYQLSNEQVGKVLGAGTSIAKQTDIFHARVGAMPLAEAFEKAIAMIGQKQAGDPESSISLNVDPLKPVSKAQAIEALMKGSDAEQGDNNQTYSRGEASALMHYLEAVSAKGAQLYMARWDDISSEYIGTMLAVQNPATKELTFAQVIGFLP